MRHTTLCCSCLSVLAAVVLAAVVVVSVVDDGRADAVFALRQLRAVVLRPLSLVARRMKHERYLKRK